ncbi:MAG TPA: FAD-dependent oxidoreductase [Acidimicrobiales bacterium]|jgi:FAD dependent oxidoreductase TIGR03364|nr:FAD-dependent oxidoreductase [Acidimicrobiales bacterium]
MSAPPGAVVVGGGIIGTWHALELLEAGFTVDHLEADRAPVGASVRNFGLVWVSGRRNGSELDVARRARRRWEEIGSLVPDVGFRPCGSLTVATTDSERAVMTAFARLPDAAARTIRFLEPDDVRACNPAIGGDVTGALHCELDAVVEPRLAPAALRAHLATRAPDRYRFHQGRRVTQTAPCAAVDTSGTRWEADLVVIATGAAYDHLAAAAPLAERLRRVRLQMFETEPFRGRLATSVADADTLRYYPAYEPAPRHELGQQNGIGAAHHLQLLVVQRPDGGLTIGDTHAYGEPFDFALCEEPTAELLARAGRILGAGLPPIRRRWEGVYAECTDGAVCLREQVDDGVWLVTGPGGRGMTCAPAIARDTLDAAGVAA